MTKEALAKELHEWKREVEYEGYDNTEMALASWLLSRYELKPKQDTGDCEWAATWTK